MSTNDQPKPQEPERPCQTPPTVGDRKVIFVRAVEFPRWAKDALAKSIDSAVQRYGKTGG